MPKLAAPSLHVSAPSESKDSVIFAALSDELKRSMDSLQIAGQPAPFIIDYRLQRERSLRIDATLGEVCQKQITPWYQKFDAEVVLGNYHRTSQLQAEPNMRGVSIPMAADYNNLRRQAWMASDARYKQSLAALAQKMQAQRKATLPEDEQEAYLAAHYQQGQAEAALMEQAVEAGEYLEPLQPMIDKWEAAGKKADQYLSEADAQCKEIYKKYGPQKSGASEKEQIQLTLKYYQEIAPIQRTAVGKAMKVRLEEQLPIAEEIEKEMVAIRAAHPNMISSLLRYPQLTATSFFSDITRLTDAPEY
jgi:hypothetical protein